MIDLSPHFLTTVKSILERRVPEREVWAFGSRVKATARKFSDLDLAILGETPLPLPVVAALRTISTTPTCLSRWTSSTGLW
jgi:predicted nucleotidyltransferase